MGTLQVFFLGYVSNVDLGKVQRLLNKLSPIEEVVIGPMVERIGERDWNETAYSLRHLFGLFPASEVGTVFVGITARPIQANVFSESQQGEILITLDQADEFCHEANRELEDYIVFALLGELLWLRYAALVPSAEYEAIFHRETRGCLFDYCEHKDEIVDGLRACRIEEECKKSLTDAGVSGDLVEYASRVLDGIRNPTLIESFTSALKNPLISFLFGGVIIGLVTNLIASVLYSWSDSPNSAAFITFVIVTLIFLGFLVILVFHMFNSRRNR